MSRTSLGAGSFCSLELAFRTAALTNRCHRAIPTMNAIVTAGIAAAVSHAAVTVAGECGAARRSTSANASAVSHPIEVKNRATSVRLTSVLAPRILCASRVATTISTPTPTRSRNGDRKLPTQDGSCPISMNALTGHPDVQLANGVGTG